MLRYSENKKVEREARIPPIPERNERDGSKAEVPPSDKLRSLVYRIDLID